MKSFPLNKISREYARCRTKSFPHKKLKNLFQAKRDVHYLNLFSKLRKALEVKKVKHKYARQSAFHKKELLAVRLKSFDVNNAVNCFCLINRLAPVVTHMRLKVISLYLVHKYSILINFIFNIFFSHVPLPLHFHPNNQPTVLLLLIKVFPCCSLFVGCFSSI